ncbi:uncharacterized protein [Amphiura filiformis]|uniref:uncharacterized protein n=1 Tax=Amphiura filiformis TaxID=82378 RepID=UPI003B2229A5
MARPFGMTGILVSILVLQTLSLVTLETPEASGDENDVDLLGSTTTADLVDLICSCREMEIDAANKHRDCYEVMQAGATKSGIYTIYPSITNTRDTPVVTWCDLETHGGGWTVLQKRQDGSVDFDHDWDDYKHGFGHVGGEYWLGNQNIYVISNQKEYEFQVEAEEYDGTLHVEKYNHFRLSDEAGRYTLFTGTYTGKQDSCINPLGMESGDIPDSKITASSAYTGAAYKAPKARLKSTTGWIPGTHDVNQWIQVDLGVPHVITGVVLQGRHDSAQWVKTYTFRYHDGLLWRYILDDITSGNAQVFDGSTNQNSATTTYFKYPVKARYTRIEPETWQSAISLRFELLGCEGTFLAFENNRAFSTKDIDNDVEASSNCAAKRSAWWYGQSCTESDLNYEYMTGAGPLNRGIIWRDFSVTRYSIKRTEMKIRPVNKDD